MLDKSKIQSESIRITVTAEDKQCITQFARNNHLTISELIRRALKAYIEGDNND